MDDLEHLMNNKLCLWIPRHGFKEKFYEVCRRGEAEKMIEVYDECNQIVRSTMMFNQQNIKATYLWRHKE